MYLHLQVTNMLTNRMSVAAIFCFCFSDNKQAVIAVLHSNSELIKDALSELAEVCASFCFMYHFVFL